ncbi:hypothetical protein ACG3SL_11705 [Sphingomonas sp. CJ20]
MRRSIKPGMLLLVVALLALAAPRPTIDLRIDRAGVHALVRIGFASVRIAFDFGHRCSQSDSCAGV